MNLIVGTAGHIDHGKTALVKALTGVDTDRLPEEKRRGITVDLGFAEMTVGEVHFGFVDVPGHEKFVRNMLAGAHGMDIVLLVVAADEGVMPQTREHFDICRLFDIQSGVIALTKSDLVDKETLEIAKLDVAELVKSSFLENAPLIAVSSRTGAGIEKLRSALANAVSDLAERKNEHIARLPIDRSFSVKGFGTVVTGTLAGEITADSKLELLPDKIPVRVRGLQTHGSTTQNARTGQRTAVNLGSIDHKNISRGMTLAEAGVLQPTQALDVEIEILPEAKPLRSRRRVRVHLGTAETLARVRVLNDTGEIAADEKGFAQLRFEKHVVAVPGERFIIRSYSPQRTIAGGRVIDNLPSRHRRKDFAEICKRLKHKAELPDDKAVYLHLLIDNSRENGSTPDQLAARTALRPKLVESVLKELVVSRKIDEHDGKFYLPAFLPRTSVVKAPNETIELSPAEVEFKIQILSIYKNAKLDVPRTEEVIERALGSTKITLDNAKRLMSIFVREGEIVKVSNEFCFDRNVVDDLGVKIKKYADTTEDRIIDVPRFKEIACVSRKYAIPLLEYFDRVNITRRVGEKRVVLK